MRDDLPISEQVDTPFVQAVHLVDRVRWIVMRRTMAEGWTLAELADAAELPTRKIREIFIGGKDMSIRELAVFAYVLRIDLDGFHLADRKSKARPNRATA